MSEETPDSEDVQSVASTAMFGAGVGDLSTWLMWASHVASSCLQFWCLEDSWSGMSGDSLRLERTIGHCRAVLGLTQLRHSLVIVRVEKRQHLTYQSTKVQILFGF